MGSWGQRRIGRVTPTWTGTDSVARIALGSVSDVLVITSKTTAPGPSYPRAALTVSLPPAIAAFTWGAGEGHRRLLRVKLIGPPDGFATRSLSLLFASPPGLT